MRKNIFLIVFILCAVLLPRDAFSSDPMVKYLCELGRVLYYTEDYEEALKEFRKVLLLEPSNRTAKKYIDDIFVKTSGKRVKTKPAPPLKPVPAEPAPVKEEKKQEPSVSAGILTKAAPAQVIPEATPPPPEKTPAYKNSLQRLLLEAQRNVQKIDEQMRRQESKAKPKQSVNKEEVMEKQLVAAEGKKK